MAKPVNHTIVLLETLTDKYKLDFNKLVNHVDANCRKSLSMKLYLSGLMFELSVNYKGIIQKLS
jgi:hypothetical protein